MRIELVFREVLAAAEVAGAEVRLPLPEPSAGRLQPREPSDTLAGHKLVAVRLLADQDGTTDGRMAQGSFADLGHRG